MWRHYQEWHNETNVFVCPYTSCSSTHGTSQNLEEHIETYHRQPPTLPTEPEIICFVEGNENAIEADTQNSEDGYFETDAESRCHNASEKSEYSSRNDCHSVKNDLTKNNRQVFTKAQQKGIFNHETRSFKEQNDLSSDNMNRICAKLPQNEDLLITKENFLTKYEARSSNCNGSLQVNTSIFKKTFS